MKKRAIFLIPAMFFCFIACNKDDAGVLIRVNNNTSADLKKVLVNGKGFENVESSVITSYQSFENALSIPVATLITPENDTVYAGKIYFDWIEHLANGKYTLKIYEDTATLSGYDCVYIKD